MEDLFRAMSGFAALASGSVVGTAILCPEVLLNDDRPFSQLVFFISFSDMVGSLSFTLGFPSNGTFQCTAQSFFSLVFFPASWLFTTAMVFQLRCALISKGLWISNRWIIRGLCISSLVCAFLPLSTNEYGNVDDSNGRYPCTIGGRRQTGFIWFLSSFFGILAICIFIMVACIIEILVHFKKSSNGVSKAEFFIIKITCLYPLGMILTWAPLAINNIITIWEVSLPPFGLYISTQYGTICALVFFMTSQDARVQLHRISTRLFFKSRVAMTMEAVDSLSTAIVLLPSDSDCVESKKISDISLSESSYEHFLESRFSCTNLPRIGERVDTDTDTL